MRIATAVTLLLAAGCASAPNHPPPSPAPPGAFEVRSEGVRTPVIVDGVDNDPAWREAPETSVFLDGLAAAPRRCGVRAVVVGGTLDLLVRYEAPAGSGDADRPEEVLDVAFAIAGSLDPVPGNDGALDVWRWSRGPGDAVGRAQDMHSQGGECREDRGSRPTGDGVRSSSEDVAARGLLQDGWWTIEFARSLSTGFEDDIDLKGTRDVAFRITLAREGDRGALPAQSPVLRLVLPPPEESR